MIKICEKCKIEKSLTEFPKNKTRKDGLSNWCKNCSYEYHKQYTKTIKYKEYWKQYKKSSKYKENDKLLYKKHRESKLKYQIKYSKSAIGKEKLKYYRRTKKYKEYKKNWELLNVEKRKTYNQNCRAKRQSAEGNFTVQDIRIKLLEQKSKCYYCNKDFVSTTACKKGYHIEHKIPLARNGTNYPENICLSCPTCNFKKNAKTDKEFLKEFNILKD